METLYTASTQTDPNENNRTFLIGLLITFLVFIVFAAAQNFVVMEYWCAENGIEQVFSRASLALFQSPNAVNELKALTENGDVISEAALWSGVLGTITIILLLRLFWQGSKMDEVLALRPFSFKHFGLFFGAFLLVGGLQQAITSAAGVEIDFMTKVMESVTDKTIMLLGVGIIAPIFEELMLRGLAMYSIEKVSNHHVAIIVTSVVFALLHLQYPWPVIASIVPLGIVLGYARAISGSLLLPIILHIINNSVSVLFFDQFG